MSKPGSPGSVRLHIGGDVSGQIAIGNNILQIGEVRGGIVNIIAPDQKPHFSRRAPPVYLRPRSFPGLLDRVRELGTASDALQASEAVSIHGQNGLGKTTLLRHLAYHSPRNNCPDGTVYFSARGQNARDLLQTLFETFFDSDRPAKPTDAQLHQMLQGIRALILLDDVALAYDQITELINGAPQCIFVFAAVERCLWGEGCCIQLEGLPVQDAMKLIEHELGRALEQSECEAAEAFCRKVKGSPLYLIQAAALVRQGKKLTEIEGGFQASEEAFLTNLVTALTESQRRILAVLAASANFPLAVQHLSALVGVEDVDRQLKSLLDLHLIQANSPAFNLTGSLAISVRRVIAVADWEDRLVEYFVSWVRQNPPLPDITDALDLILSLLEKANRDGRWNEVIALGRGIEKALILGKRWQTWFQVLEWILKAAQALGDRAVQGWALHELGTRDLCLGNLEPARQSLSRALQLREALGDKAGAAVTRHNLGLIMAPPAPPRETPRSRSGRAAGGGTPPMLKALFALMGLAAAGLAVLLMWVFILQPRAGGPPTSIAPQPATRVSVPPAVQVSKTPARRSPTSTRPWTKTRTPAPAAQKCGPGILYCENFEDNRAQDWQLDPGWSIQKDGLNYLLTGDRHEFATLQDHSWSNFRVRFRLRLLAGTIHLNYRVLSNPSYGLTRYYVGFNEDYLYLHKSGPAGGWQELTASQSKHARGDWHGVEIAGWGAHLAVYVDGRLNLEYVDEEYLEFGSIAFETLDGARAQIDDIEVSDSGPEPPVEFHPPAPQEQPTAASEPTITPANTESPVVIIPPEELEVTCTNFAMSWEPDIDRPGMDYWNGWVGDPDMASSQRPVICQEKCLNDTNCLAFTYDANAGLCWLKNGRPEPVPGYNMISGIKTCQ